MNKQYYVYILTNNAGTALYTGVTDNLKRRTFEHKSKLVEGFTRKYKLKLINSFNREWRDLYEDL